VSRHRIVEDPVQDEKNYYGCIISEPNEEYNYKVPDGKTLVKTNNHKRKY